MEKKCNYSLYNLNWIPSHEHVTSMIQSVWQQLAAAAAESALLIAVPGRGGGTVRHTEATFAVFTLQPCLTLVSLQMPCPSNKLQSLTAFWRATANLLTKTAFFSNIRPFNSGVKFAFSSSVFTSESKEGVALACIVHYGTCICNTLYQSKWFDAWTHFLR